MRRRTNPKAVLAMACAAIGAIVAAFLVKGILPESMEKMKSLIFWGIIAAGAGGGGFFCGKFLNRR